MLIDDIDYLETLRLLWSPFLTWVRISADPIALKQGLFGFLWHSGVLTFMFLGKLMVFHRQTFYCLLVTLELKYILLLQWLLWVFRACQQFFMFLMSWIVWLQLFISVQTPAILVKSSDNDPYMFLYILNFNSVYK